MPITRETITGLADGDLSQVKVWVIEEEKNREEKRRQDAIARMKELADSVGVRITIDTGRGRPAKPKRAAKGEETPARKRKA